MEQLDPVDLAIQRGDVPLLIGFWKSNMIHRNYINDNLHVLSKRLNLMNISSFKDLVVKYDLLYIQSIPEFTGKMAYAFETRNIEVVKYVLLVQLRRKTSRDINTIFDIYQSLGNSIGKFPGYRIIKKYLKYARIEALTYYSMAMDRFSSGAVNKRSYHHGAVYLMAFLGDTSLLDDLITDTKNSLKELITLADNEDLDYIVFYINQYYLE